MSQATTNLSEYDREQIKARLAKEVLAEVPDQVTSYMKMYNIPARPSQFQQMPRESIDGSTSGRTLPQAPQQNQIYPNAYAEPPPAYATTMTEPLVKQPPLNPNYSFGAV
jgi:hypothetical protein